AGVRQDQSEEVRRQPLLRVPRELLRGGTTPRRSLRRRVRHVAGAEDKGGTELRRERREHLPGPERRELRRRLRLQLLQRGLGAGPGLEQVAWCARGDAPEEPAALDQARLPGLGAWRRAPGQEPPGDPGSVAAPDRQQGRQAGTYRRRLRPERDPVLRGPVQEVE